MSSIQYQGAKVSRVSKVQALSFLGGALALMAVIYVIVR